MEATANGLLTLIRLVRRHWLLAMLALVIAVAGGLFLVVNSQSASPAGTAADALQPQDLERSLMRLGLHLEDDVEVEVTVFMLTPTYFAATSRVPPEETATEPSLLFYVSETTHVGVLSIDPPTPLLRVDGGQLLEPADVKVLADSEHHRAMLVRYAATTAGGDPAVTENTDRLRIVFLFLDPTKSEESPSIVMTWRLPIEYTDEFASREVVLGRSMSGEPVQAAASPSLGRQPISWAAILAIMAGMLVALSPCLLSLGVYYTSVLAGVGSEEGQTGTRSTATARRQIVQTGVFFSLGFTLVYTAGGAAAGSIGQSLEHLGLITTWIRPISIGAGIVILLLAVRVAWNAGAPLVCKLPLGLVFGRSRRTGPIGAAVMGFTFAGGCLSCFAATVLPAILLYVSAVGSVAYGALLLMVFSLGTSLPALGLAFGVSRSERLLSWLQRNNRKLALASAAVMAGFGILMVTYTFHIFSGFIGQFLT